MPLPWRWRRPSTSGVGLVSYGKTDPGMQRENNEDAFAALDDIGLYLVADGVGGQPSGEIASAPAIQEVEAVIRKGLTAATAATADLLVAGVQRANRAIIESAATSTARLGMATTLSALLLVGGTAHVAHVGDCRIYRWRSGQGLECLTKDHTHVQTLVERGLLTVEHAARHPSRHLLQRALGAGSELEVDHLSERRRAGDRFLLCSDGLLRRVREEEIDATLSSSSTPRDQVEQLIELTLERGAPDNITVVVVADG